MFKKFSLAVLFGLVLNLSAAQDLLEQRVTLALKENSLEDALYLLMDEYGIPLSFSNDILPPKILTAKLKDRPVEGILDFLLRGTQLSFRQVGRQIVIYRTNYKAPGGGTAEYTISGYVENAETGERLIAANAIDRRSGRGTQTNEYGFFSLTLPEGPVDLRFSYIGYESKEFALNLYGEERIRIELRTQLMLEEVVVVASDSAAPSPAGYSVELIRVSDIEDLPRLAGESDVVRSLHFLPGVQTGTDGMGGIFVRGGDAGHNLILLDGVPVYSLSHGAGLFSIFNTDAVKNVEFSKGVYSARYGGRLASVLDVRTRDGNNREFHGAAGIGLLSGRLSLEGPLVRGKSSFFISGRRSLINWYLRPFSRGLKSRNGEDGSTGYSFYDLNAKINYTLTHRDRLYVSFYSGNDAFLNDGSANSSFHISGGDGKEMRRISYDYRYRESFTWGNQVAAFRWNHLFGPRLFSNLTLTYSRLNVDVTHSSRDSLLQADPIRLLGKALNYGHFLSSIEDMGGHADFELFANAGHHLRFGGSILHHAFRPGVIQYDEKTEELIQGSAPSDPAPERMEYALYAEDDITIRKNLQISVGLRAGLWAGADKHYGTVEPRFALRWGLSPRSAIRFSGSGNTQFIHLLSSSNSGLPTDLWVPSTGELPPQRSQQLVLGWDRNLGSSFRFVAETYYKRMENLATYKEGAYFLNDWRQSVTVGDGRAYGLEMMLRKTAGKTSGWIAYGLSWTDRRFESINQGLRYPFKYDRRHDLKVVLRHVFSERFSVTADWVMGTGLTFSFPKYAYDLPYPDLPVDQRDVLVYNGKNNYRMEYYHRLDLAVNARLPGKRLDHTLNAGIYNVYNRLNPVYYDIQTRIVNSGDQLLKTIRPSPVNFIPIFPYFSYSVKF